MGEAVDIAENLLGYAGYALYIVWGLFFIYKVVITVAEFLKPNQDLQILMALSLIVGLGLLFSVGLIYFGVKIGFLMESYTDNGLDVPVDDDDL